MKENWLILKARYWDVRTQQERNILKYFSWALTPVLIYFILWQPAHNAVQKLRVSVSVAHLEAERLRTHAAEVEMLRHRPKQTLLDAVALKVAVEDLAKRHSLHKAVSTLDLQEPNAVRITFASVSFEEWLRWTQALQQEQHIRADSLSVATLPQAGMVKISATLINGGAQ